MLRLGYKSLYSNTTGDNNIGIGHKAGYYLTSSNNTVIGYNALNHSSITGGYNTVLGAYAGGHGGNSNVLIGYSGWGNEDSNKLFISAEELIPALIQKEATLLLALASLYKELSKLSSSCFNRG